MPGVTPRAREPKIRPMVSEEVAEGKGRRMGKVRHKRKSRKCQRAPWERDGHSGDRPVVKRSSGKGTWVMGVAVQKKPELNLDCKKVAKNRRD